MAMAGVDALARQQVAALTRTARPKVALLGDSRLYLTHGTSGGVYLNVYGGPGFHVLQQTGGRVEVPQRLNFGVGGITTGDLNTVTFATIAANTAPAGTQAYQGVQAPPVANTPGLTPLEAAAQSDADFVVYMCGTNDRTAGVAFSTSQANIAAALTRLTQANKRVIVIAEEPRGDTTYTTKRLSGQQLSYHLRLAQWLRGIRMAGVYVVDPWPALALAASTTGDAQAGALYDGLHHGFSAAYIVGGLVAAVLNALVPPIGGLLPSSNADIWSNDNPSGSLIANPMMANPSVTPSAASGVTITGQLPANWSHNPINLSGVTIAYGTATVGGVAYLTVTLSGTPTVASPRLDIQGSVGATNLAGIASGDVLQTAGQALVQAGASGYTQFSLHQLLWASGNGSYVDTEVTGINASGGTSVMTTVPGGASGQWGGLFQTEPYTHGGAALGTSTGVAWRLYLIQNVAVAATFLIGPTAMRKMV